MSIEELLQKSADELEQMSSAQLKEYFAPYLVYIKPPLESEAKEKKSKQLNLITANKKAINMVEEMAKKLGIKP